MSYIGILNWNHIISLVSFWIKLKDLDFDLMTQRNKEQQAAVKVIVDGAGGTKTKLYQLGRWRAKEMAGDKK